MYLHTHTHVPVVVHFEHALAAQAAMVRAHGFEAAAHLTPADLPELR
jgi:hypothetical protein